MEVDAQPKMNAKSMGMARSKPRDFNLVFFVLPTTSYLFINYIKEGALPPSTPHILLVQSCVALNNM